MYELAAVCDAGRPGLHARRASVYLVGGQYHDGVILARDWNKATRSIADANNIRYCKVLSTTQLILCCWGGRLLRDQLHEMVQFLGEHVTSPPKDAATILDRWYQRITASSTHHFRQMQEGDINLALRKRFHGCFEAHGWLKQAQPPFVYECLPGRKVLQTQVIDVFDSIRRLMPETLNTTFYQFVLKHHLQEAPGPVEDLELVEEELYDDADQPGPSQSTSESRRGQDETNEPQLS